MVVCDGGKDAWRVLASCRWVSLNRAAVSKGDEQGRRRRNEDKEMLVVEMCDSWW
jgi:hypothetical protein